MSKSTNRPLDALWYQGLSLGLVVMVASSALALAHLSTGPAISAAEARDVANSLAQVLPENFNDNDLLTDTSEVTASDGNTFTVHRARKKDQVVGVVFTTSAKGYAGPIHLVMGIDRDGRVLGVRVTRHTETPGLGDKIEARRAPWILDFNDKSLEAPVLARWGVKKDGGDFDQFAGATITPRAVVTAVRLGLERFAANRAAMLGDAPPIISSEAPSK